MPTSPADTPPPPASQPRVRLLAAPALEAPYPLPFAQERRFRLAAVLALSPLGLTRDEAAALFWPHRTQAAARSNLRKLILELRRLGLPAMALEGDRLQWPVASDARDLLEGRGPAQTWVEPLPGLGGQDSSAFDDWLLAQRSRLYEAWSKRQRALAEGDEAAQALAAAQALLAQASDDAQAQRLAARASRTLRGWRGTGPAGGRRHDDVAGDEPGLIGRATELAELQVLLRERGCRLVTLLGPGGVGKSALALAILRQAGALEMDGVHWIALEDLQQAAQVPLRIAREVGARVGPRSDGWDESVAVLHGRQAMLILDNGEHLGDLPALAGRLVAALPQLRLLVTSRRRLGLAQEWVVPLAPLQAAAAKRLFVTAARRAPARLPLDPADPAVDALVDLVGHLPLALRLAAAWTRHLPPATLVQQLRDSIDLLQASESVDEHPAHQSLEASFERSWALLDPPLRPVLAALAISPGSMQLDVAQATAGATAAQIATLADASMVELQDSGRVSLHPLLRRFSQQRLAAQSGAADAALARHAAAMAGLLKPFSDFDATGEQAMPVLRPERQQIELAWSTALVQRRADWLQAMAGPFCGLVQAQGGAEAALPLFQRALALLEGLDAVPPGAVCELALEHAALHFWRGEHDACERAARRALTAARAERLARPMGQALNTLSLVALRRGQTERAAKLMDRALAQVRRAGHQRDVAIMAGNLSGIRRELGDLDLAQATAQEALQAHRALAYAGGEVAMLGELAQLAQYRCRPDEAFEWICQAEQLSERHAMAFRRASLLAFKATIRFEQGQIDAAEEIAAQAWAAMQGLAGRHYHESTLRRVLAELALARGDGVQARAQLKLARTQVLPLAQDVNARGLLWSLAVLADFGGETDLAAALAQRAERNRPPRAVLLPRLVALRTRWPAPPDPPPEDAALLRAIDRLLG